MTTNGVPNDLINNFNALTIIVSIPLLTYIIYPTLQRFNIRVGPITRITFGFVLAILSSVIGAVTQWQIYETSPCGYAAASSCELGVSPLSLWWQIPNMVLAALSECFANVTGYELAYSRAPAGMKGLVVAIFLFMSALSSAIGEILLPATKDPWLIWIWAAPAIALALQTVVFWVRFRSLNQEQFMLSEEDYQPDTRAE